MYKRYWLVAIFISIGNWLAAQQPIKNYEFGMGGGIAVYQGDLTPEQLGAYKTMGIAWQLQAAKVISPAWRIRLNLLRGRLRGDDGAYNNPAFRKQRAFNFNSPVTEFTALWVYSPLNNKNAKGFSPYLYAGGGVSFVNIKKDYSQFNAAYFGDGSDLPNRIAIDDAKKMPKVLPVIPVGMGLRYTISERWAIQAESSYRFLFTDYLDGFSHAANPAKNDHYQTTTINLVYKTGVNGKNKNGCPVIKY
ncbi:MAG: hypothetical protein RIR12_1450 [Bacteroidota bacterium]|jgi:hypothetical protein